MHPGLGPLQILYEDSDVLVVDKPAAMLTHVHPFDRDSPDLQSELECLVSRPVHIVHRLDRMTTGAMVVALHPQAARNLSDQFRNRTVRKVYLAIVRGHTPADATVRSLDDRGEEAETHIETLDHGVVGEHVGRYDEAWFSFVRVRTSTGRRHQIRRHLHSIDHPVLGDRRHGDRNYNLWAEARAGERHLYLRATELTFEHPSSGNTVAAKLALPSLWLHMLAVVCPETETWRSLPAQSRVDTIRGSD